jgi:methyl-accepting chemotaxis protein
VIGLIVVLSLGALTIVLVRTSTAALRTTIRDTLETNAAAIERELAEFVEQRKTDVRHWSGSPALQSDDVETVQSELDRIRRGYWGTISGIYLVDQEGNVVAGSGDNIPSGQVDLSRNIFEMVLLGSTGVSPTVYRGEKGGRYFSMASDVGEGFTLVTNVDFASFAERIVKPVSIGETGHLFLTDAEGRIIEHPQSERVLQSNIRDMDPDSTMGQRKRGTFGFSDRGAAWSASFVREDQLGWYVVATAQTREFFAPIRTLSYRAAAVAGAVLLITVLLMTVLVGRVVRPIRAVSRQIGTIASGEADLTQRLSANSKDEVGDLVGHMNAFLDEHQQLIGSIQHTSQRNMALADDLAGNAEQTAASTRQSLEAAQSMRENVQSLRSEISQSNESLQGLQQGVQDLDQHIEQQSSSTAESTSSVEEMIAQVRNTSRVIQEKRGTMDQLVNSAQDGKQLVHDASGAMRHVVELTNEITGVTDVISKITAQTNLLSMNAAIEAAHAGESGRGFAVVAEEVRQLADNSATQSRNIGQLVSQIVDTIQNAQDTTNRAADSFTQIDEDVKSVHQAFTEVGDTMDELSGGGQQILSAMSSLNESASTVRERGAEMRQAVEQLATLLNETTEFMQSVAEGVDSIESGNKDVDNAMNQVAAMVRQMRDGVQSLHGQVSRFQTGDVGAGPEGSGAEVEVAPSEHPASGEREDAEYAGDGEHAKDAEDAENAEGAKDAEYAEDAKDSEDAASEKT